MVRRAGAVCRRESLSVEYYLPVLSQPLALMMPGPEALAQRIYLRFPPLQWPAKLTAQEYPSASA
jgi:hypothetical protein